MIVDLTPEDMEYLSVLVAHDIRTDREIGITRLAARHLTVWDKIQAARENEDT
jgi:hypothetical protein